MKKTAMRSLRAALKLIPKPLKDKLKKNESLTVFYVQAIRKSGLFYGAPTKRDTQKAYNRHLINQDRNLISSPQVSVNNQCQAIIFGIDDTEVTVASLKAQKVNTYFVISIDKEPSEIGVEIANIISRLDGGSPTLLLNAGDTLAENALPSFMAALGDAAFIYSDTDEIDSEGKRCRPRFLPCWNPDLHISTAYVLSGVLFNTRALKSLPMGKYSDISSLVCEAWLSKPDIKVKHSTATLVHLNLSDKLITSSLCALKNSVLRHKHVSIQVGEQTQVNSALWNLDSQPLVSLIIPTKNGRELVKACIDSIREKTSYKNYEILLIDNGSDEIESIQYFETLAELPEVRVLNYPGPFNYSAINNFGVKHAKGEVVGLINNDIEVISPDWLTYMVGHVMREDIGCVGAKLLYSDGRIQHAGVVLGYGGGAGHAHKYFPRYHPGYLKRLAATQNYSAVTAACLLVKRSHFGAVSGLDEENLAVAFNDVDFCLRVRELGVRNLYCAEAELYHHESVSRGLDISPEKAARFNRELEYLQTKWSHVIKHDPAYNPNLTLKRENFAIKTKEEQSVLLASY
jgi:GT2 family glycosyltransferase